MLGFCHNAVAMGGRLGSRRAAGWGVGSVTVSGREHHVAIMIIGNCPDHWQGLAPSWPSRLDLRMVTGDGRVPLLHLVFAVLTRRLGCTAAASTLRTTPSMST